MQFILVFNSLEDSSTPIHLLQLSYKVVQYTQYKYREQESSYLTVTKLLKHYFRLY